ncbi:MAG: hypothetical protein AB9869_17825 [Verrucomicrobiia bacterium]
MTHEEQERQKSEGWKIYETGNSTAERARGLFMVIEAHFCRNPKAPDLATYAGHWLWANEDRFDRTVVDLLFARYRKPNRPRIQRGYSDWGSYGDPGYRIS